VSCEGFSIKTASVYAAAAKVAVTPISVVASPECANTVGIVVKMKTASTAPNEPRILRPQRNTIVVAST
jgi:hypothetical protein